MPTADADNGACRELWRGRCSVNMVDYVNFTFHGSKEENVQHDCVKHLIIRAVK